MSLPDSPLGLPMSRVSSGAGSLSLRRSTSIPITINSTNASKTNNDSDDDTNSSTDGSFGPVSSMTDRLNNLDFGYNRGMHAHSRYKMAHSLPLPRAPFLSARNLASDRLSNIPQLSLPESAEESVSTHSGSHVAQSYGSLRESRFQFFHQPNNENPSDQAKGIHGHIQDGAFSSKALRSSPSPHLDDMNEENVEVSNAPIIYPRSVPTHREMDRAWVEKRWTEQRKWNRLQHKELHKVKKTQSHIQDRIEECSRSPETCSTLSQQLNLSERSFRLEESKFVHTSKEKKRYTFEHNDANDLYHAHYDHTQFTQVNEYDHDDYHTKNDLKLSTTTSPSSTMNQPQTHSSLSSSLTAYEMLEKSHQGISNGAPLSSSYALSTSMSKPFSNTQFYSDDKIENGNNLPNEDATENDPIVSNLEHNWESNVHNDMIRGVNEGDDSYEDDYYNCDPDTYAAFDME